MILTYDEARERAARGAALLDGKSPGWWRLLVPESVVMSYTDECVLGLINPGVSYLAMLHELGLSPADQQLIAAHGFDLNEQELKLPYDGEFRESFARLTDVWRNLIAERQVTAGLR